MSSFAHNPSRLWQEAVRALTKLYRAEGWENTHRAAAQALQNPIRDFLPKYFSGTTGLPVKESRATPSIHRLAGAKLPRHEIQLRPPADDHPKVWNRGGKPHFYHSQPYGLGKENLREILAFCDQYGLNVLIQGFTSDWFPSDTISVIYTKDKNQK